MNKDNYQKFYELKKEFDEKISTIVYIGWGCKLDDFCSIKNDHEVVRLIWDYAPETATSFDEDEIPVNLLWATNSQIADYFVEQAGKHRDHMIELSKRSISQEEQGISDLQTTIKAVENLMKNSQSFAENSEVIRILQNQKGMIETKEMRIANFQRKIDEELNKHSIRITNINNRLAKL
jgi:hypothetical protein